MADTCGGACYSAGRSANDLRLGEIRAFVSDLRVARRSYTETLGLKLAHEGTDWLTFGPGGIELVLMAGAARRERVATYGKTSETVLCLETDRIDALHADLSSEGVSFLTPIRTAPRGKFAGLQDPDGNAIELIQRPRG